MTSLFGFKTSSSSTNDATAVAAAAAAASIVKSGSPTNASSATTTTLPAEERSPHYHFIHSMLMPTTVKIQKELRGRRFKVVQAKLGEALVGLHHFQFESWPPPHVQQMHQQQHPNPTVPATETTSTKPKATPRNDSPMKTEADADTATTSTSTSEETPTPTTPESNTTTDTTTEIVSLDEHFANESSKEEPATTAAGGEETMEDSVVGDFSQAPQDDDLRPFDDMSSMTTTATTATTTTTTTAATASTNHSSAASTSSSSSLSASLLEKDDPLTKIPMHQSIQDALEAYILVMTHPQKTNKACEDAMSCIKQLVVRNYVSGRAGGKDDHSGSGSKLKDEKAAAAAAATATTNAKTQEQEPSLLHQILVGVQKCSESNTDTVQSQVIDTFRELLTSRQCSIHESSMLLAIRSIFHIYLVTKSPAVRTAAKRGLATMASTIVLRMEEIAQLPGNPTQSLFHTDAFYLLRSLVKLSAKELAGIDDKSRTTTNFLAQQFFTNTNADPLALNNKVLSLELIWVVMECAGDALCYGERFVHLVQSQLCVALLKNCMSNNSRVSFASQKIFLVLVYKFKTHLHEEIQVFMTNIFMRILESENSSFPQKALVLESLRSMCEDPQVLAQIFLNYDCDFDAMNLYKDIIFQLTKLSAKLTATPTANMTKKELEEHSELSLASVEVLVTILQAFLKAYGKEIADKELNDLAGKKIRLLLELENVSPRELLTDAMSSRAANDLSASERGVLPEDFDENKSTDTASLSMAESSADVAGRIVDAYDRKRNAEQNFELGAVKFTLSIKSGFKFFFENDFVTLDAKEIALFFLTHKDKLDKTQMGEVLGKEPDAAFIKTDGLDPDKGGRGFYFRILHHYIEALEFSGILFDEAIRLFLGGFRLPGEAQKIDRIMEKFAERFTRQNPEIFPNADTAFILAFSVIMLNTDLHNPSIKPERRMTIESFIRNNRGIGENGNDLPEDFLTGIFDRIKKNPFSLKEDDAAREKAQTDSKQDSYFGGDAGGLLGFGLVGAPTTEEKKRKKFKKEKQEILDATEELVRRRRRRTSTTGRSMAQGVAAADVVKPMFDVTWGPIVGILSQVIEMSTDERCVGVCFNGFVYSIRVAAQSEMTLARDTFVNSLTTFTLLGSIKEMKYKNIQAIRTLVGLAISDGEYLGDCWEPVLQCISQLARMRTAASGLASDESFLEDSSAVTEKASSKPTASMNYFSSQTSTAKEEELMKETEEMNQRAVFEAVSEQVIDNIFSSTTKLSAGSLGDFMRQLVAVSKSEIEGDLKRGITGVASKGSGTSSSHGNEDGPSIFSLQRLVEVADYNMEVRPRLVWTQVWEILGDFFADIGCHKNSMVSVFAIDSLKQLSSKFLEKPELSEFHFQRIFLRPFLQIMENPNTRQDIRELILQCVDQIVNRKADNLQSGWKIFFDVVKTASNDENDKITLLALNILQRMLDEHLDRIARLADVDPELDDVNDMSATEKRNRDSNAEDFVGMCRTSLSFIQLKDTDSVRPLGVSMRGLCHMAIYADIIADGRILPPASATQSEDPEALGYSYEGLEGKDAAQLSLWRPIFEGLATGIKSKAKSRSGGVGCLIQRGSVLAFRAILLRHGSLFSTKQLEAILNQTFVPAILEAAENDDSPVVAITSESPAVTNLDFLVDPMPLPPPRYDRGLLKFEEVARNVECAPTRPLGPAELLLEACFTDMRHGGDGDLTQAYKFAKKDMRRNSEGEQPFPDSWIATTAPVALGALTDVASEVMIPLGEEGATTLWPCISKLFQRWCNGNVESQDGNAAPVWWSPSEALVRIATREIVRFACRLGDLLEKMDAHVAEAWVNSFINDFCDILNQTLDSELFTKRKLLSHKIQDYKTRRSLQGDDEGSEPSIESALSDDSLSTPLSPPSETSDWLTLVPVLKIRCIAAHFLHEALASMEDKYLVSFLTEEMANGLIDALNRSRDIAEKALKSEDLSHAFQEAILRDWGEDDEMGEDALVNIARLSQTQGSAMFFLTQTAGATRASIKILSALSEYKAEEGSELASTWNREKFASPLLLEIIEDVLTKFVESEATETHRIDPNVWRSATTGGGVKVAVYCTSFASVVVGLLNAVLAFDQDHMSLYGPSLFPMICKLVQVHSEEIRQLVQQILLEKYAPILSTSS